MKTVLRDQVTQSTARGTQFPHAACHVDRRAARDPAAAASEQDGISDQVVGLGLVHTERLTRHGRLHSAGSDQARTHGSGVNP